MSKNNQRITQVKDATCTACGCLCDDIVFHIEDKKIIQTDRICELGSHWLQGIQESQGLAGTDNKSECLIEGQSVSIDKALERAAKILAGSKCPLIFGLEETTCEAQSLAVSLADQLVGCVDATTSLNAGADVLALQRVGKATATLGEIAQRADCVLFWGVDPMQHLPRHAERYSIFPTSSFLPKGRDDRFVIRIGSTENKATNIADETIQLSPENHYESLSVLQAIATELALDAEQVEQSTGVPLATWQALLTRMQESKYSVIFYGSNLASEANGQATLEALFTFVQKMNERSRCVCCPTGMAGNAAGAKHVLTWRTGYPFAVDFSRGYPRFGPGEYNAAAALIRQEPDAAMILDTSVIERLPQKAQGYLASIPTIGLQTASGLSSSKATSRITKASSIKAWKPTVQIRVATVGIDAAGTFFRSDGVPIPLRAAIETETLSAEEVLQEIIGRCG